MDPGVQLRLLVFCIFVALTWVSCIFVERAREAFDFVQKFQMFRRKFGIFRQLPEWHAEPDLPLLLKSRSEVEPKPLEKCRGSDIYWILPNLLCCAAWLIRIWVISLTCYRLAWITSTWITSTTRIKPIIFNADWNNVEQRFVELRRLSRI
jgi:hypothetical protein